MGPRRPPPAPGERAAARRGAAGAGGLPQGVRPGLPRPAALLPGGAASATSRPSGAARTRPRCPRRRAPRPPARAGRPGRRPRRSSPTPSPRRTSSRWSRSGSESPRTGGAGSPPPVRRRHLVGMSPSRASASEHSPSMTAWRRTPGRPRPPGSAGRSRRAVRWLPRNHPSLASGAPLARGDEAFTQALRRRHGRRSLRLG